MVNLGREFRTPRLRCHIGSIPSRTPYYCSVFGFFLKEEGGNEWKIIHVRPFLFGRFLSMTDWDVFLRFSLFFVTDGEGGSTDEG